MTETKFGAGTVAIPVERRIGSMLRFAARRTECLARRSLSPLSLSPVQYAILALLDDSRRAVEQSLVARKYGLGKRRTLDEVTGLADRGLITRVPAHSPMPTDRATLRITSVGRAVLAAATNLAQDVDRQLSSDFSREEWESGLRFLRKLSRVDSVLGLHNVRRQPIVLARNGTGQHRS